MYIVIASSLSINCNKFAVEDCWFINSEQSPTDSVPFAWGR